MFCQFLGDYKIWDADACRNWRFCVGVGVWVLLVCLVRLVRFGISVDM